MAGFIPGMFGVPPLAMVFIIFDAAKLLLDAALNVSELSQC